MKDKTSVSHDEVMVKKPRGSRAFAAEYLKAAIEDTEGGQKGTQLFFGGSI